MKPARVLPLGAKAALLSLLIFVVLLGIWHTATLPRTIAPQQKMTAAEAEYAKLMGKPVSEGPTTKASDFPTPSEMGSAAWKQLSDPFYDKGPNDKGIGIQLAYSLGRVGLGFFIAALIAIPLG